MKKFIHKTVTTMCTRSFDKGLEKATRCANFLGRTGRFMADTGTLLVAISNTQRTVIADHRDNRDDRIKEAADLYTALLTFDTEAALEVMFKQLKRGEEAARSGSYEELEKELRRRFNNGDYATAKMPDMAS